MEAMLNFVIKFSDVVKRHLEETRECIGKEIVDSNASKNGICIDRIKYAFGAKFSLLGLKYTPEDMKQLEVFGEDMLVCQGANGAKFFVPTSDIVAIGESVVLIKTAVNQPEVGDTTNRKEEVYKKYFTTKESIKEILPKVEVSVKKKKRKSPLHLFG
jgi:hypothetical protein